MPDPVQLPVPSGPEAAGLADPDELGWLPAPELAGLVRAGLADAGLVAHWYPERPGYGNRR